MLPFVVSGSSFLPGTVCVPRSILQWLHFQPHNLGEHVGLNVCSLCILEFCSHVRHACTCLHVSAVMKFRSCSRMHVFCRHMFVVFKIMWMKMLCNFFVWSKVCHNCWADKQRLVGDHSELTFLMYFKSKRQKIFVQTHAALGWKLRQNRQNVKPIDI